MTTVLETWQVAPPPGAVAEQSLPLTFFDITWLHFPPVIQLLFYEFPCSKPHFLETIVPKLKQSLSLTLKHFFPLSCNLVYPLSPDKLPVFRYSSGNSVSLTISESSDDLDDLVGNHPKCADKLYSFAPQLPPIVEESDQKLLQVLAVQVTLFPGRGVCVATTMHHSVGDAPSYLGFITSWGWMTKLGGEEEFLMKRGESLPVFDRSLVKYPQKLDDIYWSNARKIPLELRNPSLPTNRIRSTYVLSESEIKKLKELIQARVPDSVRISSFVAIAAYIWSCVAKSVAVDEVVNDDEHAFFIIAIDLRARLEPAVPGNYFGNCIAYALPRMGRGELAGDEGLFLAAQAMAAEIKDRVNNKRILESAENWSGEVGEAVQKLFFSVAGSNRYDAYSADFGWGKARKQELLMIDWQKYAMTLCKSRDFEGGFEVGISLPNLKMDAFAAYFAQGLLNASLL